MQDPGFVKVLMEMAEVWGDGLSREDFGLLPPGAGAGAHWGPLHQSHSVKQDTA